MVLHCLKRSWAWICLTISQHLVSFNRKVRVHGNQFSSLRIHRQQCTILDNEILVSFNVESLFTNVPIDTAVQAALQKLENDPSLADRTTLTPAQIADLLTFVLRSTYFQYNGSIYEQKDGAAMGCPVSAVIANLYMESFEEQAITTSSYEPRIWKRYVDDTFTILDRENVDDF